MNANEYAGAEEEGDEEDTGDSRRNISIDLDGINKNNN